MSKIIDGTEYKTAGMIKRFLIGINFIPGFFATTKQVRIMIEIHDLSKTVLTSIEKIDKYKALHASLPEELHGWMLGDTHPSDFKYMFVEE